MSSENENRSEHVCDDCGGKFSSPLYPWEDRYKTVNLCSGCFENRFREKKRNELKWWQKAFKRG